MGERRAAADIRARLVGSARAAGLLRRVAPGRVVLRRVAHEPRRERDPEEWGSVLVSHSPVLSRTERDYRAAVEVVEAPHPRTGQIGANVRGRGGVERRSEVLRDGGGWTVERLAS